MVTLVAFVVAASAHAGTYTVERGDTLGGIAARNGVSVRALAGANGITDPDFVREGTTLVIPGRTTSPPTGPAAARTHRVARGETLGGIAARYSTTVEALAAANGIVDIDLIRIGAVLRLAAPTPAAPAPDARRSAPGPGPPYTPAPPGSHRVAPGETLGGIAGRYSVTTGVLAAVNGIADPNRVVAGATLMVPWWTCPIPGAWFTDDWGAPRPGRRFHEGNDLFAPRGTAVRAPAAGTLVQVRGPVGGLQFTLEGDDGTLYIGSHLDAFGAAGRVHVGTVVGYVGTSGNAAGTAPHLHFEIHPAGSGPVNPFPTLVSSCR